MAPEKLLCHQCRRYKLNLVYCTKLKRSGDICNTKYCDGCILSRKNRGLPPLGILSSSEQENYIKMFECAREHLKMLEMPELTLPIATILITKVAGIEMDAENVGPALQFLEHRRIFSQAFDTEDGETEQILKEILQRRDRTSMQPSVLEKFQIELLNIILTDNTPIDHISSLAGDVWVTAIKILLESRSLFSAVPQENFQSASRYLELEANWKLGILNFLCDLATDTQTQKLKPFITASKNLAETEMCWEELPAFQKAITLWKKLKDEEANLIHIKDGAIVKFEEEEYKRGLSRLKEDFRKAYLEMLDTFNDHKLGPKRYTEIVKRLASDTSGRIYFQIDDVIHWNNPTSICNIDMWYVFTKEDESVIEEFCSSKRIWEAIMQSASERLPIKVLEKHLALVAEQANTESSDDELTEEDHSW